MSNIEIKNSFHKLIDNIDNELILSKFYNIMEKASESEEGQLWERLSDEEKKELLLIDSEIDNEDNLIPHSKIQEKHKKWL
jgi:hypothetical protein